MADIDRDTKFAVHQRNGWTCRSCGADVYNRAFPASYHPDDPDWWAETRPPHDPDGYDLANIDHIIPRWVGGPDDLSNLQTLCAWCNKLKGPAISLDLFAATVLELKKARSADLDVEPIRAFLAHVETCRALRYRRLYQPKTGRVSSAPMSTPGGLHDAAR